MTNRHWLSHLREVGPVCTLNVPPFVGDRFCYTLL